MTDPTIKRYRAALVPFVSYLIRNHFNPVVEAEFDDLLIEWKNTDFPSKSAFEGAVAALEHVLPAFKGKLPWARAVIAGWSVAHQAAHTIPLCEGPAHLLAVHLSADGHPRLAAGILLQSALGLRPSDAHPC